MTLNYNNEQRRKNNEHLSNVISCVIYLAKQGIAFRDNDENAGSLNRWNFLELLKFKSQDIPDLKERLESTNCITQVLNHKMK